MKVSRKMHQNKSLSIMNRLKHMKLYQIILMGIVGLEAVLFVWIFTGHRLVKNNFEQLAQQILAHCLQSTFKPGCYDEEIPKLMDAPYRITMEDAFAVTKLVQKEDPQYLYCHVLGHKLSYKETNKDVSKWKDVVARCPTTMCNNGCQHGAMMRRFNTEILTDAQINGIKPDLVDVCEPRGNWKPVEVERSMCYHALGHLAMFVTGANINKSIDLCQSVTHKPDGRSYEQTCTEGVLMTVYQPLEAEDRALVKDITPKKEDVGTFCNRLTGEGRDACFRESWPLLLDEIQTPEGLVKFCSYTKDENEQWKCTLTAMNILTIYQVIGNEMKLDTLNAFCTKLPLPTRSWCYGGASARLLQIDPAYLSLAVDVCTLPTDEASIKACNMSLGTMIQTTFHSGSAERKKACVLLEKQYQSSCEL